MPQLTSTKKKTKSTIKVAPKSIALITGKTSLVNQLKQTKVICHEITKQGNALLVSDFNKDLQSALSSAHSSKGSVIGYFTLEEKVKSYESLFTKINLSNSNYSHNNRIMLDAADAAIVVLDAKEELKYMTQPIKSKILIGILTNQQDQSRQLLDLLQIAGVSRENYIIDSSPINLVAKIFKQLRQIQLTKHS